MNPPRALWWALPGLVILFFLSPYILLLGEFGFQSAWRTDATFWDEVGWALKNSIMQSLWSACGSVFIGLWLAVGLNRVAARYPRWLSPLQALLLAPVLLPPFFILLTFLSWMNPFPFGIAGIVLIHVFLMSGLAAVMLRSPLNEKLGELSEMAEVLGARRWAFLRTVTPLVRREVLAVYLFLFVWSFTSFSIPFVVGGGRGTTLEILIYEKVRIAGDLPAAVLISLLQTGLLAIFLGLQFPVAGLRARRLVVGRMLQSGLGLGLVGGFAVAFAVPWLLLSWQGFPFILETPGFLAGAVAALGQSVLFAGIVGLATLALLSLVVFFMERPSFARFFQLYFPASLALVGLAGLGLGPYLPFGLLYVAGLLLMFTPSLMRLGLDSGLAGLREQIEVARILGARPGLVFARIVLPQLWPRICLLGGLAFLWTLGDFALAKFFFESGETLPLLIENLMSSYRVEAALSLGHFILIVGALGFFAFWRLGRVFDS